MPDTITPNRAERTEGLDIVAACPRCGGANAWRLLQTLRRCDFCDSALWWPRDPSRPPFLVAEDTAEGPEALLDVLRTLDAVRERARLAGIRSDLDRASGHPVVDRSTDPSIPGVNELKAQRGHLFSLEAHHKVLAPYVLVSSTLAFHALGRPRGSDLKEYRNLFFLLEEIAPAYQAPWDFRDRGLWVAKQRLRPLEPEHLAVRPIPRQEQAAELERLTARWRGQRLLIAPDLEPVAFDSSLLAPQRFWVFRPFHYVRARTPMRHGWFLVDGQFANVAGYPDDEEVIRATARDWKPLEASEIRGAAPRAIGFRCPECAADVPLVERVEVQLCSNCGRLLEPSPDGLKTRPYAVVERASVPWWPRSGPHDVVWLPFYRVETSVKSAGARLPDFATLLRATVPVTGTLARLMPSDWPESWVPAFEGLSAGRYDAWAFEWAEALTRVRPERWERRFFLEEPVAKTNRVLPVAVRWETLRPLLPRLLLQTLPKPIQSRLNPVALKKIFASSIDATKVGLVYVPAPVTRDTERRVLGPATVVAWAPLRDGAWPPDLQRDARRAMERGKRMDEPREAGGIFQTRIEFRSSS